MRTWVSEPRCGERVDLLLDLTGEDDMGSKSIEARFLVNE